MLRSNRRNLTVPTPGGGKALIVALLVGSTFIWASGSIIARFLYAQGLEPLSVALLRVMMAFIIVGILLMVSNRGHLKVTRKDVTGLILYGVAGVSAFSYTFLVAVQQLPVAIALVLMYTGPVFMVVASIPVFGERLTSTKVVALILALTGCFFVSGGAGTNVGVISVTGLIAGLGCGVAYAFMSVYGKIMLNRVSEWTLIVYGQGTAGLVFLVLGGMRGVEMGSLPVLVWILLLAGALAFVPAYIIFLQALRVMSAGAVGIILTLEPVWAAVLALLLFSELLDRYQIAGGLCVLMAVIIVQKQTAPGQEDKISEKVRDDHGTESF